MINYIRFAFFPTVKVNSFFLILIFCIFAIPSVYAAAIPNDLTISAEIDFDLTVTPFNASQDATIAVTSGGIDETRTLNGTTVSGGSTPLSSTLTDINDGISFSGSMAGMASTDFADAVLFSDLFIDIENSSSTTAYQLSFRVDYQLTAESNGVDATSYASVNIFDDNTLVDILFDEVVADTLVPIGPADTGMVSSFFDVFVDIGPLSVLSLAGAFGMDGLAFEPDDNFNVSSSLQIALIDVTAITSSVPEPNVVPLLIMGLLGFQLVRRNLI